MIEILYKGVVHYRRPDNHPDVKLIENLINSWKKIQGCSLYSIREVPLPNIKSHEKTSQNQCERPKMRKKTGKKKKDRKKSRATGRFNVC